MALGLIDHSFETQMVHSMVHTVAAKLEKSLPSKIEVPMMDRTVFVVVA